MLLLSSSKHHRRHGRRGSSNAAGSRSFSSSSPSFWIAGVVGALLVSPPEAIERWLPMVAPFPKTFAESEKRRLVDRIVDDCWGNDSNSNSNSNSNLPSEELHHHQSNSGYDVGAMDEWIVDHQKQNLIQLETEIDDSGFGKEDDLPNTKGGQQQQQQHRDTKTGTTPSEAAADSLFSNYFLSLHLLFSLPSFGDNDDHHDESDGGIGAGNLAASSLEGRRGTTAAVLPPANARTTKPSTYGEITPLGARQLFGAMGLLDRRSSNFNTDPVRFVDLGSGTGKLVGQVFLELSSARIEKATGVELSPSRHQSAFRARRALMEKLRHPRTTTTATAATTATATTIPQNNHFGATDERRFELIEGDLFDADLSSTTHIYVASLCFPDNLMLRLEERLRQRIARQQRNQHNSSQAQDGNQTNNSNHETTISSNNETVATLRWVATLRRFPNNLGGIVPVVRFMEMSWSKPLGCAVYLYRCDGEG